MAFNINQLQAYIKEKRAQYIELTKPGYDLYFYSRFNVSSDIISDIVSASGTQTIQGNIKYLGCPSITPNAHLTSDVDKNSDVSCVMNIQVKNSINDTGGSTAQIDLINPDGIPYFLPTIGSYGPKKTSDTGVNTNSQTDYDYSENKPIPDQRIGVMDTVIIRLKNTKTSPSTDPTTDIETVFRGCIKGISRSSSAGGGNILVLRLGDFSEYMRMATALPLGMFSTINIGVTGRALVDNVVKYTNRLYTGNWQFLGTNIQESLAAGLTKAVLGPVIGGPSTTGTPTGPTNGAAIGTDATPSHVTLPPASIGAPGVYTFDQLQALWNSVGGDPAQAVQMAFVAHNESTGISNNYNNSNKSPNTNQWDCGLWQIGTCVPQGASDCGSGDRGTPEYLYNPINNATWAVKLSSNGTNLSPWYSSSSKGWKGASGIGWDGEMAQWNKGIKTSFTRGSTGPQSTPAQQSAANAATPHYDTATGIPIYASASGVTTIQQEQQLGIATHHAMAIPPFIFLEGSTLTAPVVSTYTAAGRAAGQQSAVDSTAGSNDTTGNNDPTTLLAQVSQLFTNAVAGAPGAIDAFIKDNNVFQPSTPEDAETINYYQAALNNYAGNPSVNQHSGVLDTITSGLQEAQKYAWLLSDLYLEAGAASFEHQKVWNVAYGAASRAMREVYFDFAPKLAPGATVPYQSALVADVKKGITAKQVINDHNE